MVDEAFKKISIDGDLYFLTVPEFNMMDRFLLYCRNNQLEVDKDTPCYTWKLSTSNGLSKQLSAVLASYPSCFPVDHFSHAGWRPMLIPLGKNGKPDMYLKDRSGLLVRGGSLNCSESGRSAKHAVWIGEAWNQSPVLEEIDGRVDAPEILDSRLEKQFQIPWVAWEGKLVCSRVLIRSIPIGKILKSRNISSMFSSSPDVTLL